MLVKKIKLLSIIILTCLPLFSMDDEPMDDFPDTESVSVEDESDSECERNIDIGWSAQTEPNYLVTPEKFDRAFWVINKEASSLKGEEASSFKVVVEKFRASLNEHINKRFTAKEWQNFVNTACDSYVCDELKKCNYFVTMKMILEWIIKPY